MTTIPQVVKVKRLRDAAWAKCRDCDHVMQPGLYWSLASSMWLHTSGTGHKRWHLFNIAA